MAFWKGDSQIPKGERRNLDWAFFPPFTPRIILTDRADGTLWLLAFSTNPAGPDGLGYISIMSPVPERPDQGNVRIYAANDGPIIRWVSTPQEHSQGVDPKPAAVARLIVRGGYLGFERIDGNTTTQGRTMARQRVQRSAREIIRPTTLADEGPFAVLGWREMEF